MPRPTPLLELQGIGKRFGATIALHDVSFDVRPGEVHALVGENGAGKSTLLSIMNGLQEPDAGELRLAGQATELKNPAAARRRGLALVHQELALCPNLSVAENMFLGDEPRSALGRIDRAGMLRRSRALLQTLHVAIDPSTLVSSLNLSERQLVEICKALAGRPRVLVLDEPTASLTDEHVRTLLATIGRLRSEGLGIVYVSHRLEEVLAVSDRITVLRDGAVVAQLLTADTGESQIIRAMVGRELGERFPPRRAPTPGPVLLEATGMAVAGRFRDVSLTLRAGEIVGIAGLLGCERECVMRALFGLHALTEGHITVNGTRRRFSGPTDAIEAGIAYMPADRKAEGLVLGMSVNDNLSLTTLPALTRFGLIGRSRRNAQCHSLIQRLKIRAADPDRSVVNLSGGNQQKVVLGKWLAKGARVWVVEEPTRGVDVGGKAQIWATLHAASHEGRAIVMVSSELPELMGMCDRILVMSRGRVTGEFERQHFNAQEIARRAVAVA